MDRRQIVTERPPAATEVEEVRRESRPAGEWLRIFQVLTAAAGAALFVMGLVAIFRVDFGADLLDETAVVGGFGFSAVAAIAALLLGGAVLATSLGDQDRGITAFVGLLTLLFGIGALIAEGQVPEELDVDRRSAGLFIIMGAAVFVLSLVPWWSGRRTVTRYER